MVEEMVAKYGNMGSAIAVLSATVFMLVRDKVNKLNEKKDGRRVCPVEEIGGTPMTKEAHDEVCDLKLSPMHADIMEIKNDVKEVLKNGHG